MAKKRSTFKKGRFSKSSVSRNARAGRSSRQNLTISYKLKTASRAVLLGSAAMGAMALLQPQQAYAGPDECLIEMGGTLVTCSGDQSDGVSSGNDFTAPPVTTLTVDALTVDITPDDHSDGINFSSESDVTVNAELGDFLIVTTGEGSDGIRAYSSNGSVTITSTGDIRTNGSEGANAFDARAYANGDDATVTVSSTGDITTNGSSSDAFQVYSAASGYSNSEEIASAPSSVTDLPQFEIDNDANTATAQVTSTGDISVNGSGSDAFDVEARGNSSEGWDHHSEYYSSGNANAVAIVTSTGDITVSNSEEAGSAFEVDAFATGYGDAHAIVNSTGTVSSTGTAFDVSAEGGHNGSATASVTSSGDVTTSGESADAFRVHATADRFYGYVDNPAQAIVTDGDHSTEINTVTAEVTSVGDVTVSGSNADGFDVEAISPRDYGWSGQSGYQGSMNAVATVMSTGDVTVSNSEEAGSAFEVDAIANGTGSATATVVSEGTITSGGTAFDVNASSTYNGSATASVTSSGDINSDRDAFQVNANANGYGGIMDYGPLSLGTDGSSEALNEELNTVTAEVTSTGNIATSGDGFDVSANAGGRRKRLESQNNMCDVDCSESSSYGVNAVASVTSTGDITTNSEEYGSAFRVYAISRGEGDAEATVNSTGTITVGDGNGFNVSAYAGSGGDATASVTSSGSVTTNGEYSDAFRVNSAGGYNGFEPALAISNGDIPLSEEVDPDPTTITAEVVSTGDVTTYGSGSDGFDVSATASNNYGWFNHGSSGYMNASASISSTGDVSTYGDYASAIEVSASVSGNGNATATAVSDGNISTDGNFSYGILASAFVGGDGMMSVGVTSSGDISTTGNYAHGIFAFAEGNGDGSVQVTSEGDITTSGNLAQGILAIAESGDVSVTSTGNITTTGDYASGIVAASFGSTVTITNTGNLTTTGPGALAFALDFQDGDANASIISDGDVTTSGFLGGGLTSAAGALGAGNATATVDSMGDITTTGFIAPGLSAGALSAEGDALASVTSTGDISTESEYSAGINAVALAFGEYSNTYANVSSTGNISTSGDYSFGIFAATLSYGTGETASSITSTGNITTLGDGADGIHATMLTGGDITINSTGDISTGDGHTGSDAQGIYAFTASGDIIVNSSGNITTVGEGAGGIAAASYGSTVSVTSNGDITTMGDDAIALSAYAYQGGDGDSTVNIMSTGNLTTSGNDSTGILGETYVGGNGNATVTIASTGNISTGGSDADGIFVDADVEGNGDASIVATSTGDVSVTGDNSYGIALDADVEGDGNASAMLTSTGNVMTSGAYSDAFDVEADVDGDGAATITVTSIGDITTSGNSSHGFDIDTDTFGYGDASTTVSSTGDVSTSGNYAEAFDVEADVREDGNATVVVSSAGAVTTSGNYAEAFDVDADVDGDGNVMITVMNTGAVTTSGYSSEAFDIDSDVFGDGNASISVTSDGDVSTSGNYAEAFLVDSYVDGDGDATVSVMSSGDISTSGEYARAVFAMSTVDDNGDATISVTSAGNVDTLGGESEGFDLEATTYGDGNTSVTLTSNGDITTDGEDSEGIDVESYLYGDGNASISVTSTGNIATTGDESDGVELDAYVYGNGNSSVMLTSMGDIATTGTYANGIEAESVVLGDGDASININSSGDISTSGNYSNGIFATAYAGGSGEAGITVNSTGDVTVTGAYSSGIYALAQGSDVAVTSTGDVSATGFGIVAAAFDFGDNAASASITSSGNVTTSGNFFPAIYGLAVASGAGDASVSVQSTGDVSATSSSGYGDAIRAFGYSSDGNSSVSVTSTGNVSTVGNYAYGINAFSLAFDDNTSSVVVNSTGDVSTMGNGSSGIFAYSNNGITTVSSSGNISTLGDFAEGIFAVGNGATTVNSTGDVSTSGDSAVAIAVMNYGSGMTSVSSSGNVSSASSNGIYILGGQTGDSVSLTTSGNVNGGTDGIFIDAGTGDLTVQINSDVTGADDGIVTITQNGTDITIAEGQTVTGSLFGLATTAQGGSTTSNDNVNIFGQVNGLVATFEGDDILTVGSTGVINSIAMLGTGDDTVNLFTNNVAALFGGDGFDTLNFSAAGGGTINNSGGAGDSITQFEEYNFLTGGYVLMGLNQGLTNTNFLAGQTILAGMLESFNSTIGVNATLLATDGSSITGDLTNNGTLDVNGGFIGTLAIDGDYEQNSSESASGSVAIDFLTGLNDLITVSGDVSLDGALNFTSFVGALPGTSQTIIDGGTGLNGVFSDVNGLLSGLLVTQTLEYDTSNFDVNVVASAVSAATIPELTVNQINAGDNLIGLLSDLSLDSGLQGLGQAVGAIQDNNSLQIALEELHPEYLDVGLKFLTTAQTKFMDMLLGDPDLSFDQGPVKLASLDGVPATVSRTESGASVWGALQVFRVEQDGGREFVDFDGDAFELAAGINGIQAGPFSFGFAGGYSDFEGDTDGSSSSPVRDEIKSEIYHLGVSMEADLGEIGNSGTTSQLDVGLAYASGENEFTVNGTDPVTGLSTRQSADVDTSSVDGLARITFENDRWPITPHIQAGVNYYEQDPTTIVAGASALAVAELENTRSSVGIGATYEREFNNGIDVKASLTGIQYFGDTDNVFSSRFISASSSSASFQTSGFEVEQQVQFDASLGHTYNSGARVSAGVFGETGDLDIYGAQIRFDMPLGKTERVARKRQPVVADPPAPVICDDGTRVLRLEDCPMPVTPMAEPAPAPDFEELQVIVYFDHDMSDLAPAELAKIDIAVASAGDREVSIVMLEGHTDRSGSLAYNEDLSRRRALVVRDALVERGINVGTVTYEYFGETQPAVETQDGVKLRENRRTEIIIRIE